VKQFILSVKPDKNNFVRLTGSDFHYLVRVRRLAAGEVFPAVLPEGGEALIQILSVDNGALTGRVGTPQSILPPEKLPPIVLFQAMARGDKMDVIVRQAAEGGITEIVPFVSEFSAAKTDSGGQKFARWERIVKEARQQCGSRTETAVRRPLKKNGIFEHWKKIQEEGGAQGLLFHHLALEQESLHGYLNIVPRIVALAVGPEGGFSAAEVSLFLENGFKPLKIGDTILRTETAALYCAAAVKILLLERNSWELKQAKENYV
jgi:16S rRNA (uracil1498-N3)-methyltransferase